MAERWTTDDIARIFKNAGDSVTVINKDKDSWKTNDEWKEELNRNVTHLEIIKKYKKEDDTTSIWTTENFTEIDAAIESGKSKIAAL